MREQTLWHLAYESAAPIQRLLALNVSEVDQAGFRSFWSPDIR